MGKNFINLKITLSAVITLAFLVIPLVTDGQAKKADFSGTWALNAEKSSFRQGQGQSPQGQSPQGQSPQGQGQGQGQGMRGGFGSGNFTAKQEANLLTVERTRGDRTITSRYTLDGKESVNSTGRGESKSVATWSSDGKTLTIVTKRSVERDGKTTEMKTTENWSLASPTSLSVVSVMNTSNGERKMTMVYDKK